MVHDVPIGELKVNYAREKLDVSEQATIKKLLNIMTKAYSEYGKEYTAITRRTDIDAPTKLRVLRENQYPFNHSKCLEDCGVNENQKYPFKYKAYKSSGTCYVEIPNNLVQNELKLIKDTADEIVHKVQLQHITRTLKNGCEFTHNNERKLT